MPGDTITQAIKLVNDKITCHILKISNFDKPTQVRIVYLLKYFQNIIVLSAQSWAVTM